MKKTKELLTDLFSLPIEFLNSSDFFKKDAAFSGFGVSDNQKVYSGKRSLFTKRGACDNILSIKHSL